MNCNAHHDNINSQKFRSIVGNDRKIIGHPNMWLFCTCILCAVEFSTYKCNWKWSNLWFDFNDILLNIDEYFGPKFSVINGTCQHYISHRILRWAQFNFHKLSASALRIVRSWAMVQSELKRFLKKSRINSLLSSSGKTFVTMVT